MSNIAKESVPGMSLTEGFPHGWITFGTTATRLTDRKFAEVYKGVLIVADSDNTATVFIGRSAVTSGKETDTGGLPLPPGASLTVPLESPQLIYAISTIPDQKVAWMTV